MKQIVILLSLATIAGTYACQSETDEAREGLQLVQIDDSKVVLECRDISQATDETPHHEVYIIVGDNRVKVADTETCGTVDPASYAELGIPEKALAAVGGWWKGQGDFVYAQRDIDRIVVKKATLNEANLDAEVRFLTVATFSSQDLSPNPEWNKADLVGVYTYEGEDRSWIMFIGMANRDLSAMLFQIPEKLPAPENIGLVMGQATPDPLRQFQVNLLNLSFNSHLGPGMFEMRNETLHMIFKDEKNDKGKGLQLTRMSLPEN